MTGPEDSQGHEMSLVMPFVVVKSVGGPYDDDAFCAGWALGKISAALSQSGTSWSGPVPPAYLPQLDLIAMDRGRGVAAGDEADGWVQVTVTNAFDGSTS